MSIVLRPYQNTLVERTRANFIVGRKRQLLVLPTGGGKTVCFSYMAGAAKGKGLNVWILAHRVELLEQISKTLTDFGIKHGMIAPGFLGDRRQQVQVASVFTLARRLDRYDAPDLIIVDEAHHAISKSTWGTVINTFPNARLLGVTATPIRLSGEGLGDLFQCMVQGPTVTDLIEQGALSPYRLFAPAGVDLEGVHSRMGDFVRGELADAMNKRSITGDAVTHYQKLARGKRAIAFCVSVEHAEHVAAQFREAGIPAASIDGGMDKALRRAVLASFTAGDLMVLTSCDLVSEGFDVPAIEVAILLRPTQSLGLYLQQVGRALRTFPGKAEAIILDHAGNVKRHGLPDEDRIWSLDGKVKKRASKPSEVPVKTCPQCFATVASASTDCLCGHHFAPVARVIDQVEGNLEEVNVEQAKREARAMQGRAQTESDLVELGKSRGMKRPELWARHVIRARHAKEARA
ncbi:SSL2 DNA or RNA helicases of superfamily II [uncultured Caudovirales phage]|uniref:SSL2 DNA or RNA helicases of superfamily II n=1 Tax=uncultured Caudovirales phage TaxID=2100421 RepID=A0A6J5RRC1_9CAUD|nr:SSL2 DNA or RNA helicases of superfamily II [uncultured Caudovirales phage]